MPKDSLSDALFELREKDRKRRPSSPKARPAKRGRPKAFDPFYLLCTLLMTLGIGLQLLAILAYS